MNCASLGCLVVLGIATSAAASPAIEPAPARLSWEGLTPRRDAAQQLGERQLELLPRRDLVAAVVDEASADPYVRISAFAQLTGGGRGRGDAGVGAAAAVAGIGCDVLAGTVHGRLGAFDDGAHATGEATYAVCLAERLITVRFDGRRGVGLAPGLDARRSIWSRRYDAVYDQFTFAIGEIESGAGGHTIASMTLGHGATTQQDGIARRTAKELDAAFVLYRYRHAAGLELGVITAEVDATKADSDLHGGVTSAFVPLRLRYATPTLFLAARGGWGATGGTFTASSSTTTQVNGQTVASSSWTDTIDGEGLPEMTALVGDLEAGVRRGRVQAKVGVARTFYPTFDGNVAREARATGAVTYAAGSTGRTQLTLAPFAVRTRTWTRSAPATTAISAGASLLVGRALRQRQTAQGLHQLRVDAIGEAAISPYARLDGDRLAASTLGGQLLVALSGTVAR